MLTQQLTCSRGGRAQGRASSVMEMGQYRSLEQSNARLQEWIREELAWGEAWQRQYEALVERQTRLGTLLQAKSLQALEQKAQARQQELEETQEAMREFCGRKSQCQLHLRKQEKENRRLAGSVTELESQVSKQRRKETSGKELLREMRAEGGQLKRHLSAWEAECRAEGTRVTEVGLPFQGHNGESTLVRGSSRNPGGG
ncbi:uncharacterized protein LOC143831458 [Paroedura picta]|uniref:uncharacterized protein LOC143831458 n=1 Tax=Paroedura picta TaxID=143630 RepID=UPI004056D669